jgi:3-(3-hydroxy-phenyl)propionate hydroxylase
MAGLEQDVLIVGGGPTGLTLANLLGVEGVAATVIERNPGCVPEPRAVALDGESMRTLQAAGLADTVGETIKQGFVAEYVNGGGTHLFSTDLSARPYGFCLQNTFDQPRLERQLLAGLARFEQVNVLHDTELLAFTQDAGGVRVTVRDSDGERRLAARYLVACDGGRSTVRQQLGIAMQGERLPQKWLVVDTVDRHLGDDPACVFYCDPARPHMTIARPDGERRWEWMLLPGERDEEMLEDARIAALLTAHTDPSRVEVYRKCVYGFSSVVAERFRQGAVFLAGDAAHMTPPFAGQGLNAGIRDVRNLGWKLARVLDGTLPASLLDTYHFERHDAARDMVNLAVALGDQIQPTDPAAAAERDAFFAELNADPAAAARFGADVIAQLRDVRLSQGWFLGDGTGGRMLPQPGPSDDGASGMLDDRLGPGFCALVIGADGLPDALPAHPLWRSLAPKVLDVDVDLEAASGSIRSFIGDGAPGVLLLRPDRFALGHIRLDGDLTAALDTLANSLDSGYANASSASA